MSTSAAATSEPGPCPCRLTYEALDRRNLLTPVTALCTAIGRDGNPCNRPWADHPRECATAGGASTAVDVTAEQIPSTSYTTPIWVDAVEHSPGGFGTVTSDETLGSVAKARRYASKIELLRVDHHRKINEKYFCSVEREGDIEVFRIYFTRRSTHSTYPIFQCPLHQVFLRDCYVHFRLCNHDMQVFAQFLFDNGNRLPPTGLPLSPPEGQLRNHHDPELETFRNAHYH